MKSKYTWIRRGLASWLVLLLAAPLVQAETWIRYQAKPGSKLRIEGTSTLKDWTVSGGIISGFMELESNFPLDPNAEVPESGKLNVKVEVSVPVRSLKTGNSVMDSVVLGALNEEKYPKIQYELSSLSLRPRTKDNSLQFAATGLLTISGISRPSSMIVKIEKLSETRLKVTGEAPLKMTDFGIEPPAPKLALGLLKTGDDIKVIFEWIIAVRK